MVDYGLCSNRSCYQAMFISTLTQKTRKEEVERMVIEDV